MVSWALINTFALPLGIFLIRNGFGYYRAIKQTYELRRPQIRETSPQVSRALNILFATALAFLIYTLPYFSPPNIFTLTSGRLQTSTDVLFARLAALPGHGNGTLSAAEQALKQKLTSTTTRLIYITYGPDVITNCTFCIPKEPMTYLIYALPALALPHLLNLIILGLATSTTLGSGQASRWRIPALYAAIALAGIDLYAILTYDMHGNVAAARADDIDFFHWRCRTIRGIGLAAIDALLGAALYLSATGRFFLMPVSSADRVRALGASLHAANFRLWAAGNVRNAVVRDDRLRAGAARYWAEEKGVYEEREVVASIGRVLGRTDMRQLQSVAEQRAKDVIGILDHAMVGEDEGTVLEQGEDGAMPP